MNRNELSRMAWSDLRDMAQRMGLDNAGGRAKDGLINWILDNQTNVNTSYTSPTYSTNSSYSSSTQKYTASQATNSSSILKKLNAHNFNIAKQNIQEFAKDLPGYVYFGRYETDGGLFGWGSHSITGSEMNSFVNTLENKLISQNNSISKIVSEFTQIYKAFESLDKDYIQGIITAIEGAEKASQQALDASGKALENDVEIKRLIHNLEITSKNANEASQKALTNEADNKRIIDSFTKTIQPFSNKFTEQNQQLQSAKQDLKKKVDDLGNKIQTQTTNFDKKVSDVKTSVENFNKQQSELKKKVDDLGNKIQTQATNFDKKVSDVKTSVENCNKQQSELKKKVDDLGNKIQTQTTNFDKKVSELKSSMENCNKQLQEAKAETRVRIDEIEKSIQTLDEKFSKNISELILSVENCNKQMLEFQSDNNKRLADQESLVNVFKEDIGKELDSLKKREANNELEKFKQSTNTKLFVAYSVSGISLILVLLKMFGIL